MRSTDKGVWGGGQGGREGGGGGRVDRTDSRRQSDMITNSEDGKGGVGGVNESVGGDAEYVEMTLALARVDSFWTLFFLFLFLGGC